MCGVTVYVELRSLVYTPGVSSVIPSSACLCRGIDWHTVLLASRATLFLKMEVTTCPPFCPQAIKLRFVTFAEEAVDQSLSLN